MISQNNMIFHPLEKNFLNFFYILIPISLAIGPAVAEYFFNLFYIFMFCIIWKKKDFFFIFEKVFILFYIFYLILIISSVFSDYILLSLKSSISYLRMILFLLASYYFFKFKFFDIKYLPIFIGFMIFVYIDSLFQIFTGTSLLGNAGGISGNPKGFNISGIFFSEEVLGSYVSRFFPILIFFLIIFFRNKLSKIQFNNLKFLFLPLIYFISLFIVFHTGERLALFFMIMNFFIYLIFIKNLKFTFFFFIILFLLSSLILTLNDNIKSRIIDTTLSQSKLRSSNFVWISNQHQGHIISAFEIFKKNVLIGSGPNTFRKECKEIKKVKHACSTHPHNSYMQLISETGAVGLFIFLIILGYLLKDILRFKKKPIFFVNSIILIQFLPFVPSGNFFNNWMSIIYFFIISLTFYKEGEKV
jgi:O-antigen ligase